LILTCLKVSKISELWLTFLCLVITWENKSAGGESVFSLQCSYSTTSLPSEINSSSFSQGSIMGFSITLPLRREMTNLTWSMYWLLELLAFALYCLPLGILLWLRWKLTFLMITESRCEFYKSIDMTKILMSSSKCRSVEVINNPAKPGSNHKEVNYINYKQQQQQQQQ